MRHIIQTLILLMFVQLSSAQSIGKEISVGIEQGETSQKPIQAQRKFRILVGNEKNPQKVIKTNGDLERLQNSSRTSAERGLLTDFLWEGYATAFKQKTVNATSNLVGLGVNLINESIKSKRKKWYQQAQAECFYQKRLTTDTQINDFYALPSTKGAMDPANIRFEGFGCKNYIEVMGDSKKGIGVFYIFCKMRRDSVGLRHIVNHSKFLVELDSLVFNPTFCNLPNDSSGATHVRFCFDSRDTLLFELKASLFSSWINQATMIVRDQKLGEFTIRAKIDKQKLNEEGIFIFDRNDPDFERLVTVKGDCFIVPRSYTGTIDGINYQPTWGTGQYRIEMTVSEQCRIVDDYYLIQDTEHEKDVALHHNNTKRKWDKRKWEPEWEAMKARRKEKPVLTNAWECIVSAYKGNGWMATFTDPATTALYTWELKKLDEWIGESKNASMKAVKK